MNDSLPYADQTHEDYEEYAMHLLEDEMNRIPPRRVEPPPAVRFRSPFMKAEYERVVVVAAKQEPAVVVVTQDDDDSPLDEPLENTLQAWERAVQRAKVAYEKERLRAVLLDISKEGSTAGEQWKQMNVYLESFKAQLEALLREQKARVDAINIGRRAAQEQAGQDLLVLSMRYANLIEKTQQLKQAVAELKDELKQGDAV